MMIFVSLILHWVKSNLGSFFVLTFPIQVTAAIIHPDSYVHPTFSIPIFHFIVENSFEKMTELIKTIIQELGKEPFKKKFTVISFDSLKPELLLQVNCLNKINHMEDLQNIENTCYIN